MWILHFSISQLDIIKSRLKFAVDLATGITLPAKVYFIASNCQEFLSEQLTKTTFFYCRYTNNFLLLLLHRQLSLVLLLHKELSLLLLLHKQLPSFVVTQTTSLYCCYTNNFLLLSLYKQPPSIVTQKNFLLLLLQQLP